MGPGLRLRRNRDDKEKSCGLKAHLRPLLSHPHGLLPIMSGDLPEIEESDHLLAQTARMDFAFARHVQERALDSDDPKDLADLARAYTRLTRSLRQNLALLAKQKAE